MHYHGDGSGRRLDGLAPAADARARCATRSATSTTIVAQRQAEADEFYDAIHPPKATADEKLVQRQALAGLLWTKQIYLFDVDAWLDGDNPDLPPPDSRTQHPQHRTGGTSTRCASCRCRTSGSIPWFAAWDLAFHCVALALVDPEFAKEQLWLLLFEQFQHPNGQIPAYEWEFSDLNPPVHAWASGASTTWSSSAPARPTASSWRSASTSC